MRVDYSASSGGSIWISFRFSLTWRYIVCSLESPHWGDSNEYILYSILFYPITLEGRRGTTDEFATTPFHLDLFSAALVELAKSIPVHSLILSSHLFFCLPLFLFPFTVPCRIVFAKPEDLETCQTILAFVSWPGSGVRHILQWLLGSFCEPPHW